MKHTSEVAVGSLHRALTGALALGAMVVLSAAGTPRAGEPDRPAGWTPALTMKVKRVGSVQVSPDGKQVAFTVRRAVMEGGKSEYLTHIHLGSADGSHAAQLTRGDKSCDDPQWSPDGRWLAFVSGRSGKKNLWLISPGGGEAQRLSDVKTGVGSFKWSPDGKWLAFTAVDPPTAEEEKAAREKNDARVVDENVKLSRLHVIPVTAPPKLQREARLLTKGDFSVGSPGSRAGRAAFDWSPDGKALVFSHTRTPSPDDWPSADLSLVELPAGGTVKTLASTRAAEYSPLYSPDGKWVAYVASDDPPTWGGAGRVRVVPSAGGPSRPLADTSDGFGRYSELVGWSADGSKLYFTEVHGTSLKLLSLPLKGPPVAISRAEGMASGGVFLNARRTAFGFGWETLSQAPEAFVSAAERFEPVQVSRVHRDLPGVPLGRTGVIRWKSADGLAVEGLLTYPVGFENGKRYPLLLVVHGGPMGAFTQGFTASAGPYPVAAFASRGYAVLRANVRGSSGYGKKFRHANYGDWGGGDFKDLMSGVDHVIGLGVADPKRLGVMGWSYGGFMTSWVIAQTNRFRAASVGAGVTNLMSFTGTADIPSFLPDYFGGEFWDKFDVYRAHSAMFHVKGVRTPTLIQHGERDLRVPLSQGQELYNALKRQGCPTKMVVYPRTPHGIAEPRLLLDCMNRNLEWFDRHIRAPEQARPAARAGKLVRVAGGGTGGEKVPATEAKLAQPFGIAFDKADNFYLVELQGQRALKVDPRGILTVLAGTGKKGHSGDGGPARLATFNGMHSLAVGPDGTLYLADTWNNCVRKLDPRKGTLAALAGTGEKGYNGDGGPALKAQFGGIYCAALNPEGTKLYLADLDNRRIRAVDLKTGLVELVAGNGSKGVPEDGADAKSAPLVDPRAVAVDRKGNVYILERSGHALRVVDARGKIRTVAGTGKKGNSGDGGDARKATLNGPKHLCIDRDDSVVIADTANHVVRRYTPADGKIVRLAGTGKKGDSGDGGDPLAVSFNEPHGVYVHRSGALYIVDSMNHRVFRWEAG